MFGVCLLLSSPPFEMTSLGPKALERQKGPASLPREFRTFVVPLSRLCFSAW